MTDDPTCRLCRATFDPADDTCQHGHAPLCPDCQPHGCRLCADETAEDRWEQQQTDARLEEIREARS